MSHLFPSGPRSTRGDAVLLPPPLLPDLQVLQGCPLSPLAHRYGALENNRALIDSDEFDTESQSAAVFQSLLFCTKKN